MFIPLTTTESLLHTVVDLEVSSTLYRLTYLITYLNGMMIEEPPLMGRSLLCLQGDRTTSLMQPCAWLFTHGVTSYTEPFCRHRLIVIPLPVMDMT